MNNYKVLALTLLLTIGFTFQNCGGSNCNCGPFEGDYFNIKGMEVVNYLTGENTEIQLNETVVLPTYSRLSLNFDVDYIAQNYAPQQRYGFSIMNSALACSCLENGWLGSKEESIESIDIITLNDFDEDHKANSSLNDLLMVRGSGMTINEYLAVDSSLVQFTQFDIKVPKAPELNETFHVKVVVELSTNETYQATSIPFILKP